MSRSQKPRHTMDYLDQVPTLNAHRDDFGRAPYCHSPSWEEPQWGVETDSVPPSRSRNALMLAVVILVTAFGLSIAILTTVNVTTQSETTPSEEISHPVKTVIADRPTAPGGASTATITPSGGPLTPATRTTPPEMPPATMTNPVVTTTVTEPAPAPATMTNPVVPNPVVTTTVTKPEPAPATMTNPLEPPPATMTNPLEPPPAATNPLEPPPAAVTNPVEPPLAAVPSPLEPE